MVEHSAIVVNHSVLLGNIWMQ